MGFAEVFRLLTEIFPQINLGVLKSVAIEHPKDVDAAVVFIFDNVLPLMNEKSKESKPFCRKETIKGLTVSRDFETEASFNAFDADLSISKHFKSSNMGKNKDPLAVTLNKQSDHNASLDEPAEGVCISAYRSAAHLTPHKTDCASRASSMNSFGVPFKDNGVEFIEVLSSDESESDISIEDTTLLNQNITDNDNALVDGIVQKMSNLDVDRTSDSHGNTESFSMSTSGKCLNTLNAEVKLVSDMVNYSIDPHGQLVGSAVDDADMQKHDGLAAPCFSSADSLNVLTSSANKESRDFTPCHIIVKDIGTSTSEHEQQSKFSSDTGSDLFSFENDMVFVEADNISMKATPQLAQLPKIDIIEEFILDARTNKKTFVSSMGSILGVMKEVEDAEAKAAKTRDETEIVGQDIVAKVEELKQTLKHAKKANDMHAGEVYGERTILASEAREVQSRLLSLSDDRNKLHSIIEEVRQTLSERFAAAKEGLAVAEQEKSLKVECARKALEGHEHNMESVMEESKKLEKLAEENLKLKMFLADHGHVVDALKGEMAVICEDVCSMKHKVDNRIPLTRLSSLRNSLVSSASSTH